MVSRYLGPLAVLLLFQGAPSRAQEHSFPAFTAELWTDAQAKGINRATFDLALKGVTPDERVIAATKRQPEYGKPVGDYVNAIVSNRRIADAQLKAREWTKTFDAVEKKFGVERWVLLALWGMESFHPWPDGQLLGRRHGPDPVHAVELRRLRNRFFR